MDSTAATAAIAALASAGAWEGVSIFLAAGDPVPSYDKANEVDAKELLRDWRRMFPPAMYLQARLVVLGAASAGVTAWSLQDSNPRAAAAFGTVVACNIAIFGYTLSRIMPVNRRLLPEGEAEKKESDAGILSLLRQWGQTHSVRTAIGAAALGAAAFGTHSLLTSK